MKPKSESLQVLLGIIGGIAAIVIFGLALSFAPEVIDAIQRGGAAPTPGMIVKNQQVPLRDVVLTNQDGQPMSYSDLRGKPVLIFWGYTHCPDVCPMTMSDFRRIKKMLGDDGEKVAFVMITADPKRDTPDVLKKYVQAFDPAFIGLTGDKDSLQNAALDLAASFDNRKLDNDGNYLVAHTSFTYLLDQQGRWKNAYAFATPVDVIAEDVRQLLTEDARAIDK
jgi:protein SCO1/2